MVFGVLMLLYYVRNNDLPIFDQNVQINISQKITRLLLDLVYYTILLISLFALFINALIWMVNIIMINRRAEALVIQKDQSGRITIIIQRAFAPLIGILHAFITTRNQEYIYPVLFLKNKFRHFRFVGTQSTQPVILPHYLPYYFSKMTVRYVDILRMTALPISIPADYQFNNQPPTTNLKSLVLQPLVHQKEETDTIVPRKKDGDYLHYKPFETGDDIRRIVWKIYAKNSELIVRMPEKEFEFANTCYMSYSLMLEEGFKDTFSNIALDYVKWHIWNVYQSLRKQNNIFLKNLSGTAPLTAEDELIKNYIIALQWQDPGVAKSGIDTRNDNVICLHSGMSLDQINNIIARLRQEQVVYFMPLSNAFDISVILRGLKKIFFVSAHTNPLLEAKTRFQFAAARKRLKKTEKTVLQKLEERGVTYFNTALL